MLEGRVAMVTGAAQGIGREYAKALADNGAAVAVADINLKPARQTAEETTSAGGRAITLETGQGDRVANMRAFAKAALELLLHELG